MGALTTCFELSQKRKYLSISCEKYELFELKSFFPVTGDQAGRPAGPVVSVTPRSLHYCTVYFVASRIGLIKPHSLHLMRALCYT